MKRSLLFISVLSAFLLCNTHAYAEENNDVMYLSDMEYVENQSFTSDGHSIHVDENEDSQMITLNIDGSPKSFFKGICAWATSEVVYDLSDTDYDYFSAYVGVDVSETPYYKPTGVLFTIFTSSDGKNWTEKYTSGSPVFNSSDAVFVEIELDKDTSYLKLRADENYTSATDWYSNYYDEAVYADAKLYKKDYTEPSYTPDAIPTVAEYDAELSAYSGYEPSGDYEALLLKREFVSRVGHDTLELLASHSKAYNDTIQWLLNDTDTLRLYLVGGKPEGTYYNSIAVLSKLYAAHKDDLSDSSHGDLYRTMMLALSLTHSGKAYFWMNGKDSNAASDAVTRYEIYKNLYLNKKIESSVFETLTVEEMRWVMNTIIDDEEIVWLNDYVRKENGNTDPYHYVFYDYSDTYDYTLEQYYSKENYDTWNNKYSLSTYNITYEQGKPKLWIAFEQGAQCGGISKTGACIWGAYKGLPNTCVSQPDHCAYIYYTQNTSGDGVWYIGNNISDWGTSGNTEHLNTRTMNDWASKNQTNEWLANYILLAQAAQNEYSKYEASEIILMLAEVYANDTEKLEAIYNKALETEAINYDAWLGLVNLYINDASKTEAECFALAERIAGALTYYPQPMNDLITMLKPKLTSIEYQTQFSLLQARTLNTAANATESDTIQVDAVKQVANRLLGKIDTTLATFSFDGENAGKIMLSEMYSGSDVRWEYSLTGATDANGDWTQTSDKEVLLTAEEIASITTQKDIHIHIIGVDYSEKNIYTIDITEADDLPSNLYANDLENKVIGVSDAMEWKYTGNDAWTSYRTTKPILSGNISVIVRMGATGTHIAGTATKTFSFTEDAQAPTQSYIPVQHLSIKGYSSQQTGQDNAENAIDGNIHTIWHTAHDASDNERYLIIELDEAKYLTALEYVPRQSGSNGRAKSCDVYVSMDGTDWTKVGSASGWADDASSKMVFFESTAKMRSTQSAIQARYVKFVVTENHGDGRSFASSAMLNLFEDTTKSDIPDSSEEATEPSTDDTEDSSKETESSTPPSSTEPDTEESKPTTTDTEPSTDESKPATPDTEPSTDESKPATPDTKPSTDESKPATPDTEPSTDESKPATPDTKPSTKPETGGNTPTSDSGISNSGNNASLGNSHVSNQKESVKSTKGDVKSSESESESESKRKKSKHSTADTESASTEASDLRTSEKTNTGKNSGGSVLIKVIFVLGIAVLIGALLFVFKFKRK